MREREGGGCQAIYVYGKAPPIHLFVAGFSLFGVSSATKSDLKDYIHQKLWGA